MTAYTQVDFDAMPVVSGIRHCPTGDYSAIKRFGEWCSFGEGCRFGRGCSFGGGCSFGELCSFGEGCSFEGHKAKPGNPYIAFDRSASSLRKAYFFNFEDGIYVRAGCFFGTLAKFRAAVKKAHGAALAGRQYRAFADIAQMTFGEQT